MNEWERIANGINHIIDNEQVSQVHTLIEAMILSCLAAFEASDDNSLSNSIDCCNGTHIIIPSDTTRTNVDLACIYYHINR
jgi:hypothetical protein